MRNAVIALVIVAILAGGYFSYKYYKKNLPSTTDQQTTQPATENSASSSSDVTQSALTVQINADGFSPATISVKSGDIVTFVNKDSGPHRVASNPHPTHTDLPGFDSLKDLGAGESYSFTFVKKGTWGYHDHLNPSHLGKVVVE